MTARSPAFRDPVYLTASGMPALMEWYDKTRAELSVPTTSMMVSTRYGPTHLLAAGPAEAPPVILLHGMEGNALSWRHQLPGLAADFRLYALDIIGSAGKSAPIRPPFAGDDFARWLVDVLDALHLPRADFVGISSGGWLIVKLAAVDPSRIQKAVLLSANCFMPLRVPYRFLKLMEWGPGQRMYRFLAPHFVTRDRMRAILERSLPQGVDLDPAELEWFYLLALHYRYRYPPDPLSAAAVSRVTAPTMLLMGEHDQFFHPRAVIERASRLLPNLCVAEVVRGSGHSIITHQVEWLDARLRQFLNESSHAQATNLAKPVTRQWMVSSD